MVIENFSFDALFEAFMNNYNNDLMTMKQSRHLKKWHERTGKKGITISQIDTWLMQSGIIQKKIISLTDSGMAFSKFKLVEFSLTFHNFY